MINTEVLAMTDIFVSYSHVDREAAEMIVDVFEHAELQVDWDDHLRAGERFDRTIPIRIASAQQVVVLWSSNSRRSDWVLREAALARDLANLATARLDDCQPPDGFGEFNVVDLAGLTESSDTRLVRFVNGVRTQADQGADAARRAASDVRQAFSARNVGDFEAASDHLDSAMRRFELDDAQRQDREEAERYKQQTLRVLDAIARSEYLGRSMPTLAAQSLLPVIDVVLEVNLDVLRARNCKLRAEHDGQAVARAGVVIRPGSEVDDSRLIDKLLTETSSRSGPLSVDCFLLIMRTNDTDRGDRFSKLAAKRNLNAECVVWQPDDGDAKLEERLRQTSRHLCEVQLG